MNKPLKTALYEVHEKFNGKIIDFHGVYLPVYYSSIQDEHNNVRNNAGIFDVSHMGNIVLKFENKAKAIENLNYLFANDFTKIEKGKIIYSTMLNESGTVIDDLIVMCISDTDYHIVVNFVNIQKDFDWIKQNMKIKPVKIENKSDTLSIIAVQGPNSVSFLKNNFFETIEECKKFRLIKEIYKDTELIISRTGYTGEDGFEIIVPNEIAAELFESIVNKGDIENIKPCGLGCRDTLRLEAALPLYGQELDDKHSPLQSMIKWSVKLQKDTFIGKRALIENQTNFNELQVGFEVTGRGIPRTEMEILNENLETVGIVTSGTYSPTLKKNIGIAYIDQTYEHSSLLIKIRTRTETIKLVKLPFYKR